MSNLYVTGLKAAELSKLFTDDLRAAINEKLQETVEQIATDIAVRLSVAVSPEYFGTEIRITLVPPNSEEG